MKKKEKMATHRAHLYYSGRVQGVGFRYTAERLALEAGVVGWVKNMPDGRVEILCEGSKENIELLISGIRESMLGPHIKRCTCDWEKPTQEFTDFRVEFCV